MEPSYPNFLVHAAQQVMETGAASAKGRFWDDTRTDLRLAGGIRRTWGVRSTQESRSRGVSKETVGSRAILRLGGQSRNSESWAPGIRPATMV